MSYAQRFLVGTMVIENGSNTPDYILANYLIACLVAFDAATTLRAELGF